MIDRNAVLKALETVKYPGKPKHLVELNMIESIEISGNEVVVTVVFQKANDPFINSLKKAIASAIQFYVDKNAQVTVSPIVYAAPKETDQKAGSLDNVKNIIAVASGKGGVGKSTIAVNLAVALSKKGFKVGLLDADVYGPSIPKMLDAEGVQPEVHQLNDLDIMVPYEKYGVKMLSIGFFVKKEEALIWRGPMATSALKQLLLQAEWNTLDYLLIDLPPGTSDIHLTLVQEVPVTGAIIVSTPQQVALADVIKGINMFTNSKIKVPVLGIVENMAWFTPAELPENKYYIFGKEGCKTLCNEKGIALLGQIPIVESICENGDNGTPSAVNEHSIDGKAFTELAENVVKQVDLRNKNQEPTQKVEIQN